PQLKKRFPQLQKMNHRQPSPT
ncbi:hypothetical protein CFOL_v3_28085, partial [Cephalotus follicularis]